MLLRKEKSIVIVMMEKQLQHLLTTVELKIAREGNLAGIRYLKLYLITSKLIQIVNQIRTIHTISITDELTGIGNRRYFYTRLEQEWQNALRHQSIISFLMLDIDNFKRYNDTYGHLNGDTVLKETAEIIQESLTRSTDKVARWGGEEFAVILAHTDIDGARMVAEKIRATIEQHTFSTDEPTNVTVSIGINCVTPVHTDTYSLKDFVSDADKLLYHAKATGKNRVCIPSDMPPNQSYA
jgi:two-component system chemotaxis family response regulator WspR